TWPDPRRSAKEIALRRGNRQAAAARYLASGRSMRPGSRDAGTESEVSAPRARSPQVGELDRRSRPSLAQLAPEVPELMVGESEQARGLSLIALALLHRLL